MALSKPANITKDSLFFCPICLETLKSPKILPCLHTFCEQCIHERILTTGRNKENEVTEFVCPVCQTVVKPHNWKVDIWASELQTNHVILTMMAVAQGDREQECHPCTRHDVKSSAKYWCKTCVEAFCDECKSKHDWIKTKGSHDMVPIEEVGSNTSGIDLTAITNRCLTHPAKVVDSYCCDHNTLCCIVCLIHNHHECSNVKTIDDILESEKFNNASEALASMKDAAVQLLESKKEQLDSFNLNTENTEEEAARFVQVLKCKLDSLFETFTKQLHTYRDERSTNLQIRIRLLKQFIRNLDHWIHTAKVTGEFGTQLQLFTFIVLIKKQIKEAVIKLDKQIRNDTSCNVKFCVSELLQQVSGIDDIGTFKVREQKLVGEMNGIIKIGRTLDIKNFPTFEEISVQKVNSFCLKGMQLKCGVAIDKSQYMILGDTRSIYKLHVFDKLTGSILSTTEIGGDVKRLCYVKKQNQVFISCYGCEVFRAELCGKHISKPKLVFNSDYVGALCPYEGYVYILVDDAIKRFIPNATENELTLCFETNTECGLNGIGMYDDKLVYTTTNHEIKCKTVKGEHIFCFKDAKVGDPIGLAVIPSCLMYVINRENNGSLHVLSEDGSKLKTVLTKFDNITKPADIWLDTDNETLYVVGEENMEVYRIASD